MLNKGYWPRLSNALKQRDASMVQKEIHRDNVSGKRNDKIRNFFTNNKSFSHDILITPTYITDYDNKYGNEVCQYVTEDEKSILLKCKNAYDKENAYNSYEMFFIKYKADFRQTKGGLYCYVWSCDVFLDENGRQRSGFSMTAGLHLSKVNSCDEEKDYYKDFGQNYPNINCVEEFKARGWNKYILGELR